MVDKSNCTCKNVYFRAVSNNEFSLIRKLICSGASLTITNEDGLTVQDLCGESRPEFEMAINLSPRERDPKKKALPPSEY